MTRPVPLEVSEIAAQLGASLVAGEGEADQLPAESGAYGLLLRLNKPLTLEINRLGNPGLRAGLYLYFGSAKGPGGIRARLGRHLRRQKTIRWHIDHVSSQVDEVAGLVVPDLNECGLREKAMACFATSIPVPGFGSSDCRKCPAHFLCLTEMDT